MKKIFSILFLTVSLASLSYGMEQGERDLDENYGEDTSTTQTTTNNNNNSNNNAQTATIITSDGETISIDAETFETLKESVTIANFIEDDLEEDQNNPSIPLPKITSDEFNAIFPFLN